MIQIPEWIPLFPLPNVVFFPKTYIPLHIFEPRYRQMVQESLERERLIGMVLLKEGWEEGYEGNPPIYEVGSVGRIVRWKAFDNGSFTLVLHGLAKFTVQEENYDKPYRQGRIRPIQEPPSESLPSFLKEKLIALLTRYPEKGGEALQAVQDINLEDDAFIGALASNLPLTCLEKQFLLEADGLQQRGRRLLELIRLGLQAAK